MQWLIFGSPSAQSPPYGQNYYRAQAFTSTAKARVCIPHLFEQDTTLMNKHIIVRHTAWHDQPLHWYQHTLYNHFTCTKTSAATLG